MDKIFVSVMATLLFILVGLLVASTFVSQPHQATTDTHVTSDVSRFENDEVVCYTAYSAMQCKFK